MLTEWHRLHALQDLSICSVRLQFGNGVAGLMHLYHLKSVSFAGSTFDGINNTEPELLAAFIDKFAII